ncbi:MAG: hypothetical protein DWI29_01510 [Planctomycetota bacterium]|nr:MAG: hypothetical protein DWI29_01510 [Planctomycetota bacterium]
MAQRRLPIDRLWHLENSDRGFTELEPSQRAATCGSNDIAEDVPHPWPGLLLDTAKDPMLWLFAAAYQKRV